MSRETPFQLGSWVADNYKVVAAFDTLMPTGLTVTDEGRIFVSFLRWGDEVPCTVAEVVDGKAVAYPNVTINEWSETRTTDQLVSVQSVIVRIIRLDPRAVTPTTYLNDIRFDLARGAAGYAYSTDSQPAGALIVIDLASGESCGLEADADIAVAAAFSLSRAGLQHDAMCALERALPAAGDQRSADRAWRTGAAAVHVASQSGLPVHAAVRRDLGVLTPAPWHLAEVAAGAHHGRAGLAGARAADQRDIAYPAVARARAHGVR